MRKLIEMTTSKKVVELIVQIKTPSPIWNGEKSRKTKLSSFKLKSKTQSIEPE